MNKKGFSLVEMLLVLVLISIVFAIVLPNVMKMTNASEERKIRGYKELITENLEMYVIDKEKSIEWVDDTATITTATITFEDLKNVNPDIDINDCSIKGNILEIKREQKNTSVGDTYRYSYNFTLICNETEYKN